MQKTPGNHRSHPSKTEVSILFRAKVKVRLDSILQPVYVRVDLGSQFSWNARLRKSAQLPSRVHL